MINRPMLEDRLADMRRSANRLRRFAGMVEADFATLILGYLEAERKNG